MLSYIKPIESDTLYVEFNAQDLQTIKNQNKFWKRLGWSLSLTSMIESENISK